MRPKTETDRPDVPQVEQPGPGVMESAGRPGSAAQGGSEPAPAQAVPPPAAEAPRPAPAQAPPPEPQPAAQPAPRSRGGRGFRLLLVLLLIIAAGAAYGGYWWIYLRGTVSTDDAYVDARIVSVAARLAERVEAVLAQEGDAVEQGQPLVRFADDKLGIRVREARAEVRSAEAKLQEARNAPRPEEIDVARAELRVHEVELELAQTEWERAQRLAKVKAISEQELERRRAAVASAQSELEVSRRELSLLLAGSRSEQIEQAEAALALARARLQAAQADVADAELRSPLGGVVARRMVDPGEVVQQGQALFQIVESANTWVVANLEEDQISSIREGQPVRLWVDAYPGREFQGRVGPLYAATLSRFSLLPSSSASGSFIKVTQRVPVRIEWAEEEMPPVYPGLNVVVRIVVDES